jgi:hypothetical protein
MGGTIIGAPIGTTGTTAGVVITADPHIPFKNAGQEKMTRPPAPSRHLASATFLKK